MILVEESHISAFVFKPTDQGEKQKRAYPISCADGTLSPKGDAGKGSGYTHTAKPCGSLLRAGFAVIQIDFFVVQSQLPVKFVRQPEEIWDIATVSLYYRLQKATQDWA